MVAVGKSGGQLTTYTDRFSYSGMTGAFPANVEKALPDIDGTTGPDTTDDTVDPAKPADPAGTDAGDYDVEYTMQTGPTRYAPMQPVPPKTITAKDTKPLYPKSSVEIARTKLPIPKIQTTLTQSQTFSVSSRENTVCSFICKVTIVLVELALTKTRSRQLPMQLMIWQSFSGAGKIRLRFIISKIF